MSKILNTLNEANEKLKEAWSLLQTAGDAISISLAIEDESSLADGHPLINAIAGAMMALESSGVYNLSEVIEEYKTKLQDQASQQQQCIRSLTSSFTGKDGETWEMNVTHRAQNRFFARWIRLTGENLQNMPWGKLVIADDEFEAMKLALDFVKEMEE